MIEDSLREMFVARVESTPSTQDVAGRVLQRGRVIRRRRAAASSVAAALALTLTVGTISMVGGFWQLDEGGQAGPVVGFNAAPDALSGEPARAVPTPGPENGIGLDLRVGDRLWTSDGRQLRLTGVGEVVRTYRVPSGWVYGGTSSVRFLRSDGTSISLSGDDDRWVISPDGQRIAFVADTVLYVADLRTTGLAVRASLDVPPAAAPMAFVGDRVAVSVESRGFDVLDPAEKYPPSWNPDVVAVYGGHGETVTGLVRTDDDAGLCVANLTRTGTGLQPAADGACDLGLNPESQPARLAPGGDWLAAPGAAQVNLVDVARTARGQRSVVPCAVDSQVTPAWADARTVVAGDSRGVVRCRTDGSKQTVALPEGVGANWELVPKLTAPVVAD